MSKLVDASVACGSHVGGSTAWGCYRLVIVIRSFRSPRLQVSPC